MTRHPARWLAALVLGGIIGFALPGAAHEGRTERRTDWECRLDMSCNAAAATRYRGLQEESEGRTGREPTTPDGADAIGLLAQGGNADAPVDLFDEADPVDGFADDGDAGAPIDLSREGTADGPVDLFEETDPVDRFPDRGDAGEPIDLSREGEADSPIDLFDEAGTDPVNRFPDTGDVGEPIDLSKDPSSTEPTDLFADFGGSSASDDAVESQLLRCAAGFGCEGTPISESDAQVLTDMTREQAGDAYAEKYPDAYIEDAFSDGSAEGSEPIDLFDEAGTDPVERFPDAGDAGEPIDLFLSLIHISEPTILM